MFVRLFHADNAPEAHELPARGGGYFRGVVAGATLGSRYKFVLDDRELPDPFARWLPEGVHGPATIVAPAHRFRHDSPAVQPHQRVIYELHVGTFTPEGTYEGAREHLADLVRLGVTTLELLPLSSSDGARGWGYDGVAHFAPFAPYGHPDELMRFIDDAHGAGLEVLLDAVYNHFGPSGNYLGAYCPEYFRTDRATPWGDAIDYRHPVMRRYLLESALYWLDEARFDGCGRGANPPEGLIRGLPSTARTR